MTPKLFEYGIKTENSDIRAHVSPVSRTIYVFPTRNGIAALHAQIWPTCLAWQPNVEGPTAKGHPVLIDAITDIRKLLFKSWPKWDEFTPELSLVKKGSLAVECVVAAMKAGRFPFWVDATEDDRENVQVKGTDIVVFCRKRVQVKCDYRAGLTGNLYLQTEERNPLGLH